MRDNNQLIDKRVVQRLNWLKWHYIGLISILFFTLYAFTPNPYHVSYTEIDYNENLKTISFTVEVFTDDFEKAILLEYKPDQIIIGVDSLPPPSELYIQLYITDKMTIIIDGIVLKQPTFKASQSNPERTIIQFSYTDLPPFKSLSVYSEILTTVFTDQQNILEFAYKETKEKALLTKSKLNHTWILKP